MTAARQAKVIEFRRRGVDANDKRTAIEQSIEKVSANTERRLRMSQPRPGLLAAIIRAAEQGRRFAWWDECYTKHFERAGFFEEALRDRGNVMADGCRHITRKPGAQ